MSWTICIALFSCIIMTNCIPSLGFCRENSPQKQACWRGSQGPARQARASRRQQGWAALNWSQPSLWYLPEESSTDHVAAVPVRLQFLQPFAGTTAACAVQTVPCTYSSSGRLHLPANILALSGQADTGYKLTSCKACRFLVKGSLHPCPARVFLTKPVGDQQAQASKRLQAELLRTRCICTPPAGILECAICVEVHDIPQALINPLISTAPCQAGLEQLNISIQRKLVHWVDSRQVIQHEIQRGRSNTAWPVGLRCNLNLSCVVFSHLHRPSKCHYICTLIALCDKLPVLGLLIHQLSFIHGCFCVYG